MKKFLIIVLIFLLILTGITIYLNQVILPQKIKSIIIESLEKQTGKDVSLKSLQFNLFKGLILRDLVMTDNQNVILSTRQVNCSIFIWPILKKQIIIPSITFKTPYIYLERKEDNTFNLEGLFTAQRPPEKKSDFSVVVLKVNIENGEVVFQDNTLNLKLRKEIKNIKLGLHLSLPASVKFNFKGEIPSSLLVTLVSTGEYKILSKELICDFEVNNLPIQDFKAYYGDLGGLASGPVYLYGHINLKDKLLKSEIKLRSENLILEKDKLSAKLTLNFEANADYEVESKKLSFKGACDILHADILGVPTLGDVKNLRGKFAFNQKSLVSDSLKAELLGKQFEVTLGIKDFKTPVLSIETGLELNSLPNILKEKFNFNYINSASGKAVLNIKAQPDKTGAWSFQGSMDIIGANLKIEKQDFPVENIYGKLGFSQNGLNWEEAKFRFRGVDYESGGSLVDFNAADIKLTLDSSELSITSNFKLTGKKIKIDQFKGKYLSSPFSAQGEIDNTDPSKVMADLKGKLTIEISNLSKLFDKKYPFLNEMKLSGSLESDFSLTGNLNDFKNCYLKSHIRSDKLSFYGLNTQGASLDFFQDQRIAKVSKLKLGFYDGTIEGSGSMDLDNPKFLYQAALKADGVKLEKLKNDTKAKNKNISGTFSGNLKISGEPADLGKLSGSGRFTVMEGKLWELNLLEGVGKLIFAKDMRNINISECSADFQIKDKYIFTDSLKLKSNVADLAGPVKLGFDQSIEGSLDIDIISDMVPVSGTLKDFTTAVAGQGGKFGTIKLSGTIKEPSHSFKPAVGNLIKGLTDVFFGKPDQ
ncbi:MAG: AsmA family protein [Candidatus Omnitrophota bacterium]